MVKPVEHSAVNAAATTGWKTGMWAVAAVAVAAVLPVALGLGTVAAFTSLIASHTIAAVAIGAVGSLATLASTAGWGALPWIAGGGAIAGAFRGVTKVSAENAAYKDKVQNLTEARQHQRMSEIDTAGMSGMQQGYLQGSQEGQEMGFHKGQEYVISQLRAAQQNAMMQRHMGGAQMEQGGKSFADKLSEQRASAQVNNNIHVNC